MLYYNIDFDAADAVHAAAGEEPLCPHHRFPPYRHVADDEDLDALPDNVVFLTCRWSSVRYVRSSTDNWERGLDSGGLSLTAEQRLLLQAIYDWFREHGTWPTFISIDRPLRRQHGFDTRVILLSIPDLLVTKPRPGMWLSPDDELRLRLLGINTCTGGADDTERFVRLLRWLAQREIEFEPEPGSAETTPRVTADEAREHLGLEEGDDTALQRLYAMLQLDHWGLGGSGNGADGWFVYLSLDIWRFRDVQTVEDCIKSREQWIAEAAVAVPRMRNTTQLRYYHVRLSTRSKPSWDEFQLDLSGEQLESRFLTPRREGRPIVMNGKTIPIDDVEQLRINVSEQSSEKLRPIVQAERRTKGVVAVGIPENWSIAAKGEDVTDQFITEPPGSVVKQPTLSVSNPATPLSSPSGSQVSHTPVGTTRDSGEVSVRLAEPDYQLLWPRALFKAEAAKLLNLRELRGWDDRCELLLEDAFVRGYQGGPLSEFREVADGFADGVRRLPGPRLPLTARQQFLRDLMGKADSLHEDASHRRPYWRERKAGRRNVVVLSAEAVVREFVALADELEEIGYFEKRFGKDCVDDSYGDRPSQLIGRELGVEGLWPLAPGRLAEDVDLLFDVIEVLHDFVARPQTRSPHSYGGCGWHHQVFEIEPGRVVYRWRVNKILQRSDLGLRLAEEGNDAGRLVAVTDDARTELVQALVVRDDGEPADQVRHAIELFRARGADRNKKRSAVAALALVLEERRHDVLETALAKSDRGALFDIANNFHIRHQDAKQKREYDDFYIDWIFWVYLSTVELTNRVIDEQRSQAG